MLFLLGKAIFLIATRRHRWGKAPRKKHSQHQAHKEVTHNIPVDAATISRPIPHGSPCFSGSLYQQQNIN
jgi:hypothetical protein